MQNSLSLHEINMDVENNIRIIEENQVNKGLFIVKSANSWIEDAKKRPIPEILFSQFWYESGLCILFANTNLGKSVLSVEQLKEILKEYAERAETKESVIKNDFTGEKYIYGLHGIRELFKVSHATAQKYKDGILNDAITQYGRKIIVNKEMALKLFAEKGGGKYER